MIEYPPGSGRYVMAISPSQGKDLAKPVTPEELAWMELEAAIVDCIEAKYIVGEDCTFWELIHRLEAAYENWHVSDTGSDDHSPDAP